MKTDQILANISAFYSDTRFLIIDELSFLSYKELTKLSLQLQQLTECSEHKFGKHAIAFFGDFCQLECISGDGIYLHENSIYWEQALTHMVELNGLHRFSQCPRYQEIMFQLREGHLTDNARNALNSRVIDGKNVCLPNLLKAKFATYHNRNCAEINALVFQDYLDKYHEKSTQTDIPKTAIVIKAGAKWHLKNQNLSSQQRANLFSFCSEADCKDSFGRRCDPLLCLFSGCSMMGTENVDVKNGIANGTTCTFETIVFKRGSTPKPLLMHGKWVFAINIEEVDHLVLRWKDSTFEGTFKLHPIERNFCVNYPVSEHVRRAVNISMMFFPVVLNHATTGHRLQGKSEDQLIISEWSKRKNWINAVLSTVRTLQGLYLLSRVPEGIDCFPPPQYSSMMERLRNTIQATPQDVEGISSNFSIESYLHE